MRRWTKSEDNTLLNHIDSHTMTWLSRKLQRSPEAIRHRLVVLVGSRSISQGLYSQRQMVLDSGYCVEQLQRARKALGQLWRRGSPTGNYLVSEDQYRALLAWLAEDSTSPRRYKPEGRPKTPPVLCHDCQKRWSRYVKSGRLCRACYARWLRLPVYRALKYHL